MPHFGHDTTGEEIVKALGDHAKGKTIVITGPSPGGIGAETAKCLAEANAKEIVLAGRNEAKIAPVVEELRKISPKVKVIFVKLDLGDQSSVRKAAAEINDCVDKIDILINNAGIMAVRNYAATPDGIESQFGTNHVGHFLLTNLLMDKILAAGKGARILNVSSLGYELGGMRFDDWNFQDGKTYEPWPAYAQAKTANILFTVALAEKLERKGILVFALHPGLILESNLSADVDQEMFGEGLKLAMAANDGKPLTPDPPKSLQQGCSTTLVAALDPSIEGSSGAFLQDCAISEEPVKEHARDPANAEKLWGLSEKLVGQKFSV